MQLVNMQVVLKHDEPRMVTLKGRQVAVLSTQIAMLELNLRVCVYAPLKVAITRWNYPSEQLEF